MSTPSILRTGFSRWSRLAVTGLLLASPAIVYAQTNEEKEKAKRTPPAAHKTEPVQKPAPPAQKTTPPVEKSSPPTAPPKSITPPPPQITVNPPPPYKGAEWRAHQPPTTK